MPWFGFPISAHIQFDPYTKRATLHTFNKTELSYVLGSTDPCPNAVHMEPFSTSVFKVLIWIFATTTKIYAEVCSSCLHKQSLYNKTSRLPTRKRVRMNIIWYLYFPFRLSIGNTLERHPFSKQICSAGKLLHTSERISTSMTTVLLSEQTHIFCDIWNERVFGHLNSTFGWSHIASSAYQKWPTKN